MILSPIRKVLSSFERHRVRALLMGGQACILYGGAEFSRDIDFAILASDENLASLRAGLADLDAEVIAVPPLSLDYLERGHAVHFRCREPEAAVFSRLTILQAGMILITSRWNFGCWNCEPPNFCQRSSRLIRRSLIRSAHLARY